MTMQRNLETLTPENIRDAHDGLVEEDFFATMGGWSVSRRRVSRVLGKEIGARYRASELYHDGEMP